MDLGKVKLPRTGLNALQHAIHPVHGIAWTDGKQVCLTSFRCADGAEPEFGDTNVVGKFEHVLGLRWGPQCLAGSPALLAVQHKKHVTVWQLQLSGAERDELLCTRACELSEPSPLLAQGCVWHPRADVLALLTRRDASVRSSVRTADPQRVAVGIRAGGGPVHCACWTGDGARLVVAVGTALHCYVWDDARRTLEPCAFCPVFDAGGRVCALEPVGEACVAAATELPLDRLCGLNAGMAFDVPSSQSSLEEEEEEAESRPGSAGSTCSFPPALRSSSPSCGPVDLTCVLGRPRRSEPNALLRLRRRDTLTGSGQDSSHLTVLTFDPRATTSRRLAVPGVLVPDIVALDPAGRTVAVASNTCGAVLVYSVSTATAAAPRRVRLQKDERPKGVCFLGDWRLLIMAGRQRGGDSAFLPSSSSDRYEARLLVRDLDRRDDEAEEGEGEASGRLPAQKEQYPSFTFPGARRGECFGGVGELVMPGGALAPPTGGRRGRLIEEVTSEEDSSRTVSPAASCIAVETWSAEPGGVAGGRGLGGWDPARSGPSDGPVEQRARDLERMISETRQCLSETRDSALNRRGGAKSSYPPCAEAPYVMVSCQEQVSQTVCVEDRRPVLLCEGRLCLRVLQDLFSLQVLEMQHGSLWLVLVPDADGFVPLTFDPKEEITVRDAKRKLPRSPGDGDTPWSDKPS